MGMLEPGDELDLALEALGADGGRELGVEQLQRYRPVVTDVVGEVDRGHAAPPKLTLDAVAVGQALFETLAEVRHVAFSSTER
jgi:hypothetical protein